MVLIDMMIRLPWSRKSRKRPLCFFLLQFCIFFGEKQQWQQSRNWITNIVPWSQLWHKRIRLKISTSFCFTSPILHIKLTSNHFRYTCQNRENTQDTITSQSQFRIQGRQGGRSEVCFSPGYHSPIPSLVFCHQLHSHVFSHNQLGVNVVIIITKYLYIVMMSLYFKTWFSI